jgi:polar amino acid transport system substrate-binding protein
MKYIVFFTLTFFFLAGYADEQEVNIYVDDAYQPFSYRDEKGEARGVYIDILRTAFARMEGYKVNLIPVPWQRGKLMMKQGKGVGLAAAFLHGHDWPYLYPYSLPFYTETIIAICGHEVLKHPRPDWPDDYIGLRISNVAGFDGWGGKAFRRLVEKGMIHYEEVNGSTQNIKKLIKGRVDCIMMEKTAFKIEIKRMLASGEHDVAMDVNYKVGAVIGEDPVYIGYSRPARERGKMPFLFEFMQSFDSEIYAMTKLGEIQEIVEEHQ